MLICFVGLESSCLLDTNFLDVDVEIGLMLLVVIIDVILSCFKT